MKADWVVTLARKDHQGQCSRGEGQFDDHVGGKNRLWTQRRGAKPLENASFAVNRDDGDQRQYGADGDQDRRENWQAHADKPGGGE